MRIFNKMRDADDTGPNFREFKILLMLVAILWLKFFSVDFSIARILNWPILESFDYPVVRYMLRAMAVGLPSCGAILCLVIPVSLMSVRSRGKALLLLDLLLSSLVLTDRLFIRYYADIFIFHDLMLIPQTGLIAKSIWSLLKPWDALIFIDIPIAVWLMKKKRLIVRFKKVTVRRALFSAALFAVSVAVQGYAAWRLAEQRPNIINAMYDRLSVCAWVSVSTFHWGDALAMAGRALASDYTPEAKIREIRQWFAKHNAVRHRPLARGKNLIMIQCEALQYFVLDMEFNGVEVTPNLNRFRRECIYFANAWNQTAGGQSADSEFMANTGMFPAASGAAYTRFADNDFNSLARSLNKKGYRCVVFQGTYSAFWNCHRMHPKLGFYRQYSRNTFPDEEVIGLGLSDRVIFTKALEFFTDYRYPFYGFIVTLSSHHPFDFEGLDDGTLVLPEDLKDTLVGRYLIAIHYFDREFGRFIDGLRKNGVLDKSLIVVYGDHPAIPTAYREDLEKLLEEPLEDPVVWQNTRRVPLMFRIPQDKDKKITGADESDTGQIDVLPTVSGLMGLGITTAFGRDLLADGPDEPVIFRNGSYMYKGVFVEPGAGRATYIKSREKTDISKFESITEEVERRLGYNDLILERNLINEILKR